MTGAARSVADQAIELLAEQLGVDPESIEVRRAEEVTWRDGSLGCPRPGYAYTQALVPGSRVELAVGGRTYWFHQGGTSPPFQCENPSEPLPS